MGLSFVMEPEVAQEIGPNAITALTQCYEQFFSVLSNRDFELEVNLFSNLEMRELNQQSRGKDYTTDVLSFPIFPSLQDATQAPANPVLLGTVVIAPKVAYAQGDRLIDLLHHGLLHICGYDHETLRGEWDTTESAIIKLAADHHFHLNGVPPDYD